MLPQRRRPEAAASIANQEYKRLASGLARRRRRLEASAADDHEAEDEGTEDEEEEEERWRQHAMLLADHDEHQHTNDYHNQLGLPKNLRQQPDEQDDSSLSIAQSGCQSILSAWRQRVSRASQRNQQQRPSSVLSNATSACSKKTTASRRGKSPASQTRIPLGPRHAQHFVTNTRRRRHADELVLNALEARRRAFQVQRQQSSLFDEHHSPDFLHQLQQQGSSRRPVSGSLGHIQLENSAGSLIKRRSNSPGLYAGSRLSLSPSPLRSPVSSPGPRQLARCPPQASPESPELAGRRALKPASSAGGASAGGNNNNNNNSNISNGNTSLPASVAQRQRLLRALSDQKQAKKRTPPLAKLDQNSSDLCSQNSSRASSIDAEEDEHDHYSTSSSSGSQFTQLVTAELVPNCALLELQEQVRRRAPEAGDSGCWPEQVNRPRQTTGRARKEPVSSLRQPLQTLETAAARQGRQQQHQQPTMAVMKDAESEELDETEGSKLRRGALKRDSIRRLRLNRQHQSTANYSTSSVSSELTPSSAAHRPPPEPKQPLGGRRQQPISTTPCQQPAARNLHKNHPPKPCSTPTPATTTTARGALQRARLTPETGLTAPLVGDENEPPATGSNKVGKQELKPAATARLAPVRYHRPSMEPPVVAAAAASFGAEMPHIASGQTGGSKYLGSAGLSLVGQMSTNEQRLAAMRAAGAQKGREAAINHLMALKESSKSRDDLRFDAAGNRLHQRVSESWREERFPNQFKSMSRRIEITQSESNNISPPPAFAVPSFPSKQTTNRHNDNGLSPSNKYATQSTSEPPAPPERPVAPTRRRAPTVLSQERPPVIQPKPKQLERPEVTQSVPQFESSADDEFRKRIEKLRMMARANTAVSSMAGQGPTGTGTSPKPIATKPMSISNWRPQPATTNLDALMLASNLIERRNRNNTTDQDESRREPPESLRGAWRRSHSSLARTSLPSSSSGAASEERLQQPPKIPSPAPVKLMVKERSTPKPDFAFVAPRTSGSIQTSQAAVQQQQQQPNKYPIQATSTAGSGKFDAAPTTNQAPPISRLRSASPKSPDFGGQPSSSNEDSAIASSVSSPSLSYMMNTSQQHHQQQLPAAFKSPQPPSQFQAPSPPTPPRLFKQPQQHQRPDQLSIRKAPESGALQSILRRQQQQFGAPDKEIVTLDNDSVAIKRQVATYQQQERAQSPQSILGGGRPEVLSAEPHHSHPVAHSQQAAAASSPAKRVHFNDLASVRSFESISSHTSNSTAVPNEMLRQQVGSPDSMASSSGQSRLSNDSPDLRSGCRDGAAIYAIRGDPELELEPPPQMQQTSLMLPPAPLLHPSVHHHQPTPIQQHQQLLANMPKSPGSGAGPSIQGYTLQRSPLGAGYPSNPLATGSELHQQQPVTGPGIHPTTVPTGFINMTAPPASGHRPPPPPPPPTTQQQLCDPTMGSLAPRRLLPAQGPIQMLLPAAPQPYLHQVVVPQQVASAGVQLRRPPAPPINRGNRDDHDAHDDDDDDDPNYAIRLRQASTRGAAYPGFPLQHQQAQAPLKPAPPVPRRMSSELCNFQTEV